MPGEELDELVLGGGGVLHFIDEQVLKIGEAAEGFDRIFSAEDGLSEDAELVEVAATGFGEDELELDESLGEDAEDASGDGPVGGGVVGGGEAADTVEGFADCRIVFNLLDEVKEGYFVARLDDELEIPLMSSTESPEIAIFLEQEVDECEPGLKLVCSASRRDSRACADCQRRNLDSVIWRRGGHLRGEPAKI